MGGRCLAAAALVTALLLGPGLEAGALPDQSLQQPTEPKKKAGRRGPQKVIEMDTLEVLGKVQKPRVYYLLGRGELKHEGFPMDRDLLKEVEDTVKGPPF